MKRIKPAGWALLAGIIIAVGAFFFVKNRQKETGSKQFTSGVKTDKEADIVAGYNTFAGVAPLVALNGGMDVNESSEFTKLTGLKLQIKQIDDIKVVQDALQTGELDLAYCTIDALSNQMGQNSGLLEAGVKTIMKVNESRGADAIVVTKGITEVSQLKGKKIAYAPQTASHTLLINVMESAGLSAKDIEEYKVGNGIDAATAFKNGEVDAAVVWAPDDADCVAAIQGSRVLVSTKTATQIIADGLLVSDKVSKEKHDQILKTMKAWLIGNARMNEDAAFRTKATEIFSTGFGLDLAVTKSSAEKIRFSTLGDNKQFFGFDPAFTGITGDKMYGTMSVKYTELGLVRAPAPWRKVSDASYIEELLNDADLAKDSKQKEASVPTFAPTTEEDKTVAAQSTKAVTIQFPTASYTLDDYSKSVIDREVSSLAQKFAGAKIRIEGNTDNTGNPAANKALSLKRANAVAEYLVRQYRFDKNKFIIVGNGQDNPVSDNNSEDGKAKNRRTDFEFIFTEQ